MEFLHLSRKSQYTDGSMVLEADLVVIGRGVRLDMSY